MSNLDLTPSTLHSFAYFSPSIYFTRTIQECRDLWGQVVRSPSRPDPLDLAMAAFTCQEPPFIPPHLFLGGMTLFSNRAALDPFVIRPSYWGGWRHPTMYRAPGPPKIAFCSGEHSFQHRLHTKSAWRKSSMRLQAAARTVLLAFCSQTPPTTFIWCSLHQCPHRSPWMQMQ